jgi:hypothetical protein
VLAAKKRACEVSIRSLAAIYRHYLRHQARDLWLKLKRLYRLGASLVGMGRDDGAAQLRFFITVVETGSFTQAARKRLHTSSSSLSRHIRDLEYQVGIELLGRGAALSAS